MDLLCLGVCVGCGVNRNRVWVFSYVMQHPVPTHTGGGVTDLVLQLINFVFGGYV